MSKSIITSLFLWFPLLNEFSRNYYFWVDLWVVSTPQLWWVHNLYLYNLEKKKKVKSKLLCCVESLSLSLFMLFVARCSPYFPFLLLLDNTGHPAPDQQMQVTKLFNHRSRKKFIITFLSLNTKKMTIKFFFYHFTLYSLSGTCFRLSFVQ